MRVEASGRMQRIAGTLSTSSNEGGSKREDAADCRNLIHIIFDESPRVWWPPDVRQDRK